MIHLVLTIEGADGAGKSGHADALVRAPRVVDTSRPFDDVAAELLAWALAVPGVRP